MQYLPLISQVAHTDTGICPTYVHNKYTHMHTQALYWLVLCINLTQAGFVTQAAVIIGKGASLKEPTL